MKTETQLTSWCRLEAPNHGTMLFRNNSGVLVNSMSGRPIRFGLGNDSKKINSVFKSSDLIGITTCRCDCGKRHGIFTAIEVKAEGWYYNTNNPTHLAQNNFINKIKESGGIAGFVSSKEEFVEILR